MTTARLSRGPTRTLGKTTCSYCQSSATLLATLRGLTRSDGGIIGGDVQRNGSLAGVKGGTENGGTWGIAEENCGITGIDVGTCPKG
ncbi:hypothetical protein HanPI659440_Chr12g0471741 [Helianthus annuus]|nr:hypothetical protein HanPI659440_Chr12g0471741 [Helianthus annuus]